MFSSALVIAYCVLLALFLDILLGEPKRWHPLVGFGFLASGFERWMNIRNKQHRAYQQYQSNDGFTIKLAQFFAGLLGWIVLVIIPMVIIVIGIALLERVLSFSWWIDAVILYLAIGYTSLKQHALAIVKPLQADELPTARQQLSMIVSRDTEDLNEQGVCKATVESVLENGSDAIFAPLFWFLVGGVPAVLVYRFTNTLDAMWGYKTERFLFFGRFSAKMDDLLNWLPSRLVGISYAVLGDAKQAFSCWQQQAKDLESPSAGVVMSSGAGALGVLLGGDTMYHGKMKSKPTFGAGKLPKRDDIRRSIQLVSRTLVLWCVVIVVGAACMTYRNITY